MSERSLEQRRLDSERLWAEIRRRIEALERGAPAPAEDLRALWRRRAIELAAAPDRDREAGEAHTLVVLRLGGDRYAVPIAAVREIQRVGAVTLVCGAPAFVRGVINLRGSILALLDLRALFGLEPTPLGPGARILIAEGAGMVLGILVEEVTEIVDVPAGEIKPPLAPATGIAEDCVAGIAALGPRMVVVIDLERVLGNPRIIVDEAV